MVPAVVTRLEAEVPALANRVKEAADFAELMRTNGLPQHGGAYVLPLGLRGNQADAAAGGFRQGIEWVVGVLLTLRTYHRADRPDLTELNALIDAVLAAICGWAPSDESGVFRLFRGQLVHVGKGTLAYQLDFAISDQLRIDT